MPAVPNAAGVPPLTSYLVQTAVVLAQDLITSLFGNAAVWGVFIAGTSIPIIVADSVISFDFTQDYLISDYPTEMGGFQSYNKVQTPFKVKLRFATGGNAADRAGLLAQIGSIIGDTQLYDAVTPESIYLNVNAVHYDYRRTANQGLGLLVVDVTFQQIRSTAATLFSNTQQPSGADASATGTVQPGASMPAPAGVAYDHNPQGASPL
jgi:hypothetical protein